MWYVTDIIIDIIKESTILFECYNPLPSQAAGRSRLLRPGQANFVFWGRLLQGGHVCPESLREFMVSFLAYIS